MKNKVLEKLNEAFASTLPKVQKEPEKPVVYTNVLEKLNSSLEASKQTLEAIKDNTTPKVEENGDLSNESNG